MPGATRMIWQKIQEYVLPHNLPMPSVWGKLPYYGDFTHIHTTPQDIDAWRLWFGRYPLNELDKHNAIDVRLRSPKRVPAGWLHIDVPELEHSRIAQPWSFVLPAGALMLAPHLPADSLIVGACAQSCDQVGRLHPIVIWQAVHPTWLAQLDTPRNWLFWLTRLLQKHTPPQCRPDTNDTGLKFNIQLDDLWHLTRRSLHQVWLGVLRKPLPEQSFASYFNDAIQLDDTTPGVRQLPWGAWSERCTQHPKSNRAYFWQQAGNGQYISAVVLDLTEQGQPQ